MKIFLSWSGEKSHEIAKLLKSYLKLWISGSKPYLSSEDILKGQRWSNEVGKELNDSRIGIICLTKDNLNSDWLLFEAGAISKSFEDSHVYTVLFDDLESSDIKGPLSLFQHTKFEKEDFCKLIEQIYSNEANENKVTDKSTLNRLFEKFWEDFEKAIKEKLSEIKTRDEDDGFTKRSTDDLLNEILELTRHLARFPTSVSNSQKEYEKIFYEKRFGSDNVADMLLAMLKEFAQIKLLTFYQPREPESPLGDAFKYIVKELHQRYNDRLVDELRVWLRINHPSIRWMASEIIGYYDIRGLESLLYPLYKDKKFTSAWEEWEMNCLWAHSKLDNNYKEMHDFLLETDIEVNQEWLIFAYQQMVISCHSSSEEFTEIVNEFLKKDKLAVRIRNKAEGILRTISHQK